MYCLLFKLFGIRFYYFSLTVTHSANNAKHSLVKGGHNGN